MKEYINVFKKCILFKNIEDSNIIPLLGCIRGKKKTYKKSETIFSEGDIISEVGIILEGSVELIRYDYYGNKSIVTKVSKGELFGESFACIGNKRIPVSIEAKEDTVVCLIDINRIINTCSNACNFHNSLIYNLLQVVAMKNIILNQKIEVTSKRSTREKLLTYLSIEAKKAKSKSFYIPYDRQGLADYLEVDRSGLSNEISKLIKENIIKSEKNYFEIL